MRHDSNLDDSMPCVCIQAKRYSLRTGQLFVQWVRRFILFHDQRHPAQILAAKVEALLSELATAVKSPQALISKRRLPRCSCTGRYRRTPEHNSPAKRPDAGTTLSLH